MGKVGPAGEDWRLLTAVEAAMPTADDVGNMLAGDCRESDGRITVAANSANGSLVKEGRESRGGTGFWGGGETGAWHCGANACIGAPEEKAGGIPAVVDVDGVAELWWKSWRPGCVEGERR